MSATDTVWLVADLPTLELAAELVGDPAAPGRHLLLTVHAVDVPETDLELAEQPGWSELVQRFDAHHDYADLMAMAAEDPDAGPLTWVPVGPEALAGWRDVWRRELGIDPHRTALVVSDLDRIPATVATMALPRAAITVLATDLSPWSPPLRDPDPEVAARLVELVHRDLLPGVAPVRHRGVPARAVALPAVTRSPDVEPELALLVVEDLEVLGLDPTEVEAWSRAAEQLARELGATGVRYGFDQRTLSPASLPPELPVLTMAEARRHRIVIGCRSALLVAAGGTALQPPDLVERLRPWAHPDRVPVVLTAALCGPDPGPTADQLGEVVSELTAALRPSWFRTAAS